jgi:hypothetical protein
MRHGMQVIHHLGDGVAVGEEGREHRATDIGRVGSGDDGIFHLDAAADGDRGRGRTRRTGVGHEHAAAHHRDVQQLRHPATGEGEIGGFERGVRLDGFGKPGRRRAQLQTRPLPGELDFQ